MYSVQRQAPRLGGIWDVLKDVGSKVGDVAGDIWSGGDGGGVRDVLAEGIDAAIATIRTGTREQVAAVLESSMSPEMRSELERAYLARRAKEMAPLLIVGLLGVVLLLKRR